MKRMKALARGILILLLCLCIQIGANILYAIKKSVEIWSNPMNKGMSGEDFMNSVYYHMEASGDRIGLAIFTSLILAIGFGLWYYLRFVRNRKRETGTIFTVKKMICIAGMAIALQLIIEGALNLALTLWPNRMEGYMDIMNSLDIKGSPFTIIYVALIGPISEELIFRGVIFKEGRKYTDFLWANVIQSLLFAIYHANLIQGFYTFILGLFLGLAMEKGRSILYAIWLHIAFNVTSCIIVFLVPEEFSVSILLFAIIIAIPILGLSVNGLIDGVFWRTKYEEN